MKASGNKLRWARNVVKTFCTAYETGRIYLPDGKTRAVWVARYERAMAILLAHALTRD